MVTAQEGRLEVDRHASLNTDQVSSTTVQRGICVPRPWKPAPPLASKPAEMLLFYSGADTDWSVERKREYFDWAKRIVDGLSAPNQMLKAEFERLYGQSESLRSS